MWLLRLLLVCARLGRSWVVVQAAAWSSLGRRTCVHLYYTDEDVLHESPFFSQTLVIPLLHLSISQSLPSRAAYAPCRPDLMPLPPALTGTPYREHEAAWRAVLRFERGNPQRVEPREVGVRVTLGYEQVNDSLSFFFNRTFFSNFSSVCFSISQMTWRFCFLPTHFYCVVL